MENGREKWTEKFNITICTQIASHRISWWYFLGIFIDFSSLHSFTSNSWHLFYFGKNRQEISTHESSSFPPLKRSYLSPRIDLKIASILFPAILSFTLRCCTRRHPQQLPMMFYNEIDTKKIDPENIWYYSIVLRSVLSLNLVVFLYIFIYVILSGCL